MFQCLRVLVGDFDIDFAASSENAPEDPATRLGTKRRLAFFFAFLSRYYCQGSAGVEFISQNVPVTPGGNTPAFGLGFSTPVMVRHVVYELAEFRAHTVLFLPVLREYSLP